MKQITILLIAIFSIFSSCTKGPVGKTSNGYTCSCIITYNNGANTKKQDYSYGVIPQGEASSKCDDQLRLLQLTYGSSTSGGQWVTCNLQ